MKYCRLQLQPVLIRSSPTHSFHSGISTTIWLCLLGHASDTCAGATCDGITFPWLLLAADAVACSCSGRTKVSSRGLLLTASTNFSGVYIKIGRLLICTSSSLTCKPALCAHWPSSTSLTTTCSGGSPMESQPKGPT